MRFLKQNLPWITLALAVLFLLVAARPERIVSDFDLGSFAAQPVSGEGRVKPWDSVARNSLLVISGRQTLRHNGKTIPAIQWLMDVIAQPEKAGKYEIFRVDHPDVRHLFGFDTAEPKRLSYNTIAAHEKEFSEQAMRASQVPQQQRSIYQRRLMELWNHASLYSELATLSSPYAVPPVKLGQTWRKLPEVMEVQKDPAKREPHVDLLLGIIQAYHLNDADSFNDRLRQYAQIVEAALPDASRQGEIEVFFNRIAPLYQSITLYVIVFLLGCTAMLLRNNQPLAPITLGKKSERDWATVLMQSANWLLVLTFVFHTLGLTARVYLQGRPPVTNLYSSAVFIGWVCVLLSIWLERTSRLGLGTLAASSIGFATLIIAHHLSADGDTMEMMQAVLDSNFWLATHVVAVTVGYSATFLAGFLAIAFIIFGVFTKMLSPELYKSLSKMIYAVVCFALFFSFVGTVLGGIWADQSWGRFWGWDPKENGAVLIVLGNAIILHARWGGMIRERGLAILCVFGNIVTAWSWFGTNMLGIGLHSYGFMESAVFYLLLFVLSQLVIMGIGMVPVKSWRSLAKAA